MSKQTDYPPGMFEVMLKSYLRVLLVYVWTDCIPKLKPTNLQKLLNGNFVDMCFIFVYTLSRDCSRTFNTTNSFSCSKSGYSYHPSNTGCCEQRNMEFRLIVLKRDSIKQRDRDQNAGLIGGIHQKMWKYFHQSQNISCRAIQTYFHKANSTHQHIQHKEYYQ